MSRPGTHKPRRPVRAGEKNDRATIVISGREIGLGRPAFIIAEVAQAHDGSLGTAHTFIEVAADAGADAIKFQTHIAAAESTLDERFRVHFSAQDETRYAYWRRMEFTSEQWRGLADHARERQLVFMSSAFSLEAVHLLADLGVPAWKVGSGEIASADLIEAMCDTGAPILLSTGMSGWAEIEAAVARVRALGAPLALLQCTSRYPTPIEQVGLNVLDEMRARFGVPVGLSDHSGTPWPALAAMARGAAALIEVHLTLHRKAFGPDVPASLTPDQLRLLVEARDAFATMDAHPVDKNALADDLEPMRALFGKSLAPTRPLRRGEVLTSDMLTLKKPGSGIAAHDAEKVIGRILQRDVSPDHLLRWDDFE